MLEETIKTPEMSVLVVDNDDGESGWQKRIAGWLNGVFNKVTTVKTYDDAIKCFSSQIPPFHVVVTEVSLNQSDTSNQDGFKLARRISELNHHTEVIVLSRSSFSEVSSTIIASIREKVVFSFLEKNPSEEKKFDIDYFVLECKRAAQKAEYARNTSDVFVVMPFDAKYKPIYKYIEKVVRELGKTCKRADTPTQSEKTKMGDDIMASIRNGIRNAKCIIAELSGNNPNVLFEIGMSDAFSKEVILISRRNDHERKPDILTGRPIVLYESELGGEDELYQGLTNNLRELERHNVDNDPRESRSIINVSPYCFVITSQSQDGEDIYKAVIKKMLDRFKFSNVYLWDDKVWQASSDSGRSKPKLILDSLYNSCAVIADLSSFTSKNDSDAHYDPTAFYLAGRAYGAGKKFKFLCSRDEEPPFDIKHLNLLRYVRTSEEGREDACNLLEIVLDQWKNDCAETPVRPNDSILFLAAEPIDRVHLRLMTEFKNIQDELSKSKKGDRLQLELPEFSLRAKDITRVLLEKDAQIVHFSGHGGSGGQLYFETDDGKALPVEPVVLAGLFKQLSKKVKCVILNACYSEKQAKAISQHIDYVVGMKQEISDKAAIAFSIGFYQALGRGETIEEAFELGKIQSGLQSAAEYQIPVLLKRAQ